MERIVKIVPGYDCHNDNRWADLSFCVKGSRGAIQFILNIGLRPQSWIESKIEPIIFDIVGGINPVNIVIHSKKLLHDDYQETSIPCEFCDYLPCYYYKSGPDAYNALYAMANGGDEALWDFLEGYYLFVFHEYEYPQKPREYKNKTCL